MSSVASSHVPPGGARPSALTRGGVGLLVAAGLLAAGLLAILGGPGQTLAAATRTTVFTGRIVSGTGHYAGATGSVRLIARSHAAGSATAFTLSLSSPSCHARARCVSLSGRLNGTAQAQQHRPPDTGAQLALSGSGRIAPLGKAVATGTASGPGFIARGRPALTLSLRTASGRVTVAAQGPIVPGFTPPL